MLVKETFMRLQNNIFRWVKIVEDHGSNSTGERILLQNRQKGNEVEVVFAEMFKVASTNHEVMFLIPFEMPEGCQRLFQLQCTFASALDHHSPQTKSTAISASSAGGMDHPHLRRGEVIGTSSSQPPTKTYSDLHSAAGECVLPLATKCWEEKAAVVGLIPNLIVIEAYLQHPTGL